MVSTSMPSSIPPFLALSCLSLALAFPSDARDLQGAHANNSGSLFKGAIQGILEAKGYEAIAYRDWQQGSPTLHEQRRVVLMDVPYESIYGTGGRIGLVIRRPGQRDIYIESQRQVVAGSVDEKLPYIVENARKRLPTADTIFFYNAQ